MNYLKLFTEDREFTTVNFAVSVNLLDCIKLFQEAMPRNSFNRRPTQAEALPVLLAHAFSCKAVQVMLEEKHAADLAEATGVLEKLKDSPISKPT